MSTSENEIERPIKIQSKINFWLILIMSLFFLLSGCILLGLVTLAPISLFSGVRALISIISITFAVIGLLNFLSQVIKKIIYSKDSDVETPVAWYSSIIAIAFLLILVGCFSPVLTSISTVAGYTIGVSGLVLLVFAFIMPNLKYITKAVIFYLNVGVLLTNIVVFFLLFLLATPATWAAALYVFTIPAIFLQLLFFITYLNKPINKKESKDFAFCYIVGTLIIIVSLFIFSYPHLLLPQVAGLIFSLGLSLFVLPLIRKPLNYVNPNYSNGGITKLFLKNTDIPVPNINFGTGSDLKKKINENDNYQFFPEPLLEKYPDLDEEKINLVRHNPPMAKIFENPIIHNAYQEKKFTAEQLYNLKFNNNNLTRVQQELEEEYPNIDWVISYIKDPSKVDEVDVDDNNKLNYLS